MVRLILMDGTIIDGGQAGYADGFLWLWISGFTLPEIAVMMFDPGKTGRIVFQYGELENAYEGFTNCTNMSISRDGLISVCLEKGVIE